MNYKIVIIVFIFIFFSSKGIKNISYDKARNLSVKKNYQTILNTNKKIDLEKYYFDIDNISEIIADKKSKTIKIFQSNKKSESFNLTEIESEKFKSVYKTNNKDSIAMIFINGFLVDNMEKKNYNIEYDAVKYYCC